MTAPPDGPIIAPMLKALAATVLATLVSFTAVELIRRAQDRYGTDVELAARALIDDLLADRRLDATFRAELARLRFDLYLADHGEPIT